MDVFFWLLLSSLVHTFVGDQLIWKDSYKCKPWSVEDMEEPSYFFECYIKSTFNLTWIEARDFCSKNGGNLLISSGPYHSTMYLGEYDCIFIGLFWDAAIGWTWVDGSTPDFESWGLREKNVPNSLGPCAAMCQEPDPTDPGAHLVWWSKRSCESRLEFMCQYDPSPVTPQPLTKEPVSSASKGRTTVFRIESSTRVLAKPDFETKAFSNIMCARECQKQLNPCDVLSYHRPTKVCVGFSSMDALSERKRHQRGWDTLVASRM